MKNRYQKNAFRKMKFLTKHTTPYHTKLKLNAKDVQQHIRKINLQEKILRQESYVVLEVTLESSFFFSSYLTRFKEPLGPPRERHQLQPQVTSNLPPPLKSSKKDRFLMAKMDCQTKMQTQNKQFLIRLNSNV